MAGNAQNIATAPRNRLRIAAVKALNFGYRGFRKLSKTAEKPANSFLYYPAAKDLSTLADLANRASWYLPQTDLAATQVYLPVTEDLLKTKIASLTHPPTQERYLDLSDRIKLISVQSARALDVDAILVWNKKHLLNPFVFPKLNRVDIVDKDYFWSVESQLHARSYYRTLNQPTKQKLRDISKRNYQNMRKEIAGSEDAFVFGTGPSLSRSTEFNLDGAFKIVCNSIVKNKELLEHIKPQLLAFADPVFHFSPCLYAAQFRRQMIKAVEDFNLYLMTYDVFAPLILAHYPALEDKIIGMPVLNAGCNFPNSDQFYIQGSTNIMTSLMVPAASAQCENIFIIGADGREPGEKYFWKHDPAAQFDELMETAYATHPSFFKDRVYENYFDQHCRYFAELIDFGEQAGKRYFSKTPSSIPVLAARSENIN